MWDQIQDAAGALAALTAIIGIMCAVPIARGFRRHRAEPPPAHHQPETNARTVREPEPDREPTPEDEAFWRPYAAELLGDDAQRYGIDLDHRQAL